MPGTGWANTEYRTYRYVDEDEDSDELIETSASRHSRGKLDPRPTREEQRELYHRCRKHWAEDGVELNTADRNKMNNPSGLSVHNGVTKVL